MHADENLAREVKTCGVCLIISVSYRFKENKIPLYSIDRQQRDFEFFFVKWTYKYYFKPRD